jgi:Xaa-Pro aminopeptidase
MSTRADRLAEAVREQGLDALLITNMPNLRWATGFTGTSGAALIGPEVRVFITDFRYVEQAAEQVADFERVRAGQNLLADLTERMSGRVGFEDQWLSVRSHGRLSDAVGEGVELVGSSGIVEGLREVKEPHELEAMLTAAKIADQAYAELAETGIAGRTEEEIAASLEVRMRELGAEDRSFPAIVASGAHGALPHAVPRDVEVERGTFMIVDLGCVYEGYCSDCTRTFATGTVSDEALEVYELVARAQLAGLDAVRAGADCRAVDSVARDIIDAGGHGEHFGHGLGHGVGLEVHEGPRLGQTASGSLQTGNTVSVEPGVYLPGKLGVRIEDLVAVTDAGCEILTGFPKELVALS